MSNLQPDDLAEYAADRLLAFRAKIAAIDVDFLNSEAGIMAQRVFLDNVMAIWARQPQAWVPPTSTPLH